MNGRKIINKIGLFFLIIICAGVISWYTRDITAQYGFASPIPKDEKSQTVSILIAGDIMLDRNVRNIINATSFDAFFGGVRDIVSSADIAVANLEGPFTNNPSLTASLVNKNLQFTFDPELAPKLAELGFDVLGLANNHTLNFGRQGLASTRMYVSEAGMKYYGEPNNQTEISTVVEKNGLKIALVGFHEFSYLNYDKVLAEIDRLRPDVDILIVSPHWGIEYQKEPTDFMRRWAWKFIDHGADAVIGAHPHIVGTSEEYNGKKVYYSLGNFSFDQYFSEDTMTGLAVRVDVEKQKSGDVSLSYTEIQIRIDKNGAYVVNY